MQNVITTMQNGWPVGSCPRRELSAVDGRLLTQDGIVILQSQREDTLNKIQGLLAVEKSKTGEKQCILALTNM